MKIKFFTIILCHCLTMANSQIANRYSEKIDSLFQKFNSKTPGYSVVVLRDDVVVYKKSFGMADVERGKPISSLTSFDMASISKQFTAMCILLLEE